MPRTSPPALCAARACHRPQLGFLLPGAVSITLGPPPSDTTPRDQAVANRCAMRSALSQARVHFCTAGCLAALAPAHTPTLPPSCLSAAHPPPLPLRSAASAGWSTCISSLPASDSVHRPRSLCIASICFYFCDMSAELVFYSAASIGLPSYSAALTVSGPSPPGTPCRLIILPVAWASVRPSH